MRRHAFHVTLLSAFLAVVTLGTVSAQSDSTGSVVEGRAVWAHPSSVAFNDSSTIAFVGHCKRANINLETLVPAFKNFDPLPPSSAKRTRGASACTPGSATSRRVRMVR